MLVEKDKLKAKMVEYISNQFWLHDRNPTFTDVYDQFQHYASKGSVSHYLDELVSDGQIVKENKGNNVFYSRPRMHIASKFIIVIVILTCISSFLSIITFNSYITFVFGIGCIFSAIFWRFFG